MDRIEIVITFKKDGMITGYADRTIDSLDGMLTGLQKPHQFMKHIDDALDRTEVECYSIGGSSMF